MKLVLIILSVMVITGCSDLREVDTPMVCRNGKAYKVIPHGNITLYSPTYDECEVTK